ncbi:MAG: ATP phosphoribosyltransferase [Nitrospinota bacterium]|nr:MAG: ATP phosphoribosyltransferase [Nitrospinota bacterium]
MKERLTIALPKGRNFAQALRLWQLIGFDTREITDDTRRLIFEDPVHQVRFLILRPTDIPTYVEYGAADMGIVGKDILAEQDRDVYEPLDLRFGFCRLVVAQPADLTGREPVSGWSTMRVATKFPHLTEKYFVSTGRQVEIIKLYGSIELAPLVGLAERIVDLVETGKTLQENGLVEVEEILKVSARLVVNRASQKTKYERITAIIDALKEVI